MSIITIKIEDALKIKMEEKAKAANEDSNSLIIKAIEKYLALVKVDSSRNQLQSIFISKGFNSDEDIYKTVS